MRKDRVAAAASPAMRVQPISAFPIVGIGASAGGLEALEEFLRNVPSASGLAFVIVQHLDPAHKGAMVELLQRATSMPVMQVKDGQKVKPDCVYMIPPNKDMSILHGVLYLLPPASPHGLNLPIDFFFRSLAEDQQEHAIGVVLSGMGSDGTLGVQAIKEKAGTAFVQSLESAKFSAMPRSVVSAGLADVVGTAAELPQRILAYHRRVAHIARPESWLEDKQRSALEKIFVLLRAHSGNDFSVYKRTTVLRRIERRMNLHQIENMASYVRYLREHGRELDLLFKELLIGVTNFFRDPPAWERLKKDLLPQLLRQHGAGRIVRAWVPGCSTGEEAYSLAIVLIEALEKIKPAVNLSFQIFASDLDRTAIETARRAVYLANIAADVSAERLRRFFRQEDHGYRIRKEIREMVVFAPQNIIMDPPFTKLDIISCRNLLIYLSPEVQKRLIPLFHYALNRGGILFLGNAESVGGFTSLFTTIDSKARIFRTVEVPGEASMGGFARALTQPLLVATGSARAQPTATARVSSTNLPGLADRVILQNFAPPAVLTNDKGDVIYFSGRTGKYLEPAVGRASLNLFAMAREELRYGLTNAFSAALRSEQPVTVKGLKLPAAENVLTIDLTVERLQEPKELQGAVMVVFREAGSAPAGTRGKRTARTRTDEAARSMQLELQRAREEAQTLREEMQTSQEELMSTNEELQSTNEELQSTNEELMTSKEEMQSMNEELQTVNHELQSKVEELSRSNNDMTNLLSSTDVATLFLDGELRVRRFTTPVTKLFSLVPVDVGRVITDIATQLDYPQLPEHAREVLQTLILKEQQVRTRNGHSYSVRILPYHTLENVIDGVVMTFTDTTVASELKGSIREQAFEAKQMSDAVQSLVLDARPDGSCESVSRQWADYTGVAASEQLGYGWLEQVHPAERERVRSEWQAAIKSGSSLETEFRIRGRSTSGDSFRWFKVRSVPIRDEGGDLVKWHTSATDVDDLKRAAEAQRLAAEHLAGTLEALDDGVVDLDGALAITYFNGAAERMFACERARALHKSLFEVVPQAAGTALAERLQEPLERLRTSSFRVQLRLAAEPQWFTVRLVPHAGGVSLLWRRAGQSVGGLPAE